MKPTHIRALWQTGIIILFAGIVGLSFFLQSQSLFPFSLIATLQTKDGVLGAIGDTGRVSFLFMILTWLVLGLVLFPFLMKLKKYIEKKYRISLSAQQ